MKGNKNENLNYDQIRMMIKKKQFTFSPKSSDSSDSDYYNQIDANKEINDRENVPSKNRSLNEDLPKISDSPI